MNGLQKTLMDGRSLIRSAPAARMPSRLCASDCPAHSDPECDWRQQSGASLSLKPDERDPVLASQAAQGAMMSVSPSPPAESKHR